MKIKILKLILTIIALPQVINAQGGIVPECEGGICTNIDQLFGLAISVVRAMVEIGIALSTIFFAWAGFLYLTSGGDPGKVTKARHIFTNVLIGFLVLFSAFAIVDLIAGSLGLNSNIINLIQKVF